MANPVAGLTRTFTASIVAICRPAQLDETRETLKALHARSVRPILITLGDTAQPPAREVEEAILIEGLTPRYLNNVVASRRLSSLPAMAWWRGSNHEVLEGLAPLVDRLVLDSDDPMPDWRAASSLVEVTSLSDLRWTRLTRWRNLMAQFFDVPGVRKAAGDLSRLEIRGADEHGARLFAGWLTSRLPVGRSMDVDIRVDPGPPFLSSVTLTGAGHRLELRLTAAGTCVQSSVEGEGAAASTRTVALGDQSLAALLEEEMRIRARDAGFEDALRFAAEAA